MVKPRWLDVANAQEHHQRFVRRALENEVVYTICGDHGPLIVTSQALLKQPDDMMSDGTPRDVYLFFSDQAYARQALRLSWPEREKTSVRPITLFDLLFRWLPGMAADKHLAGTNWTGDLIGLEVEPDALKAELMDGLSVEQHTRLRQRFTAHKRGERA